jgi:uncharacterized lipoprotein YajG
MRQEKTTDKTETMKLFALFVLAASLALVGCEKKPDSGSAAPSTNAPAK